MKILNYTPHPVTVRRDATAGAFEETFLPSGIVARCSVEHQSDGDLLGFPCVRERIGPVTGLPDPTPDTVFLVSRLVAAACPARRDLVVPGSLVRDGSGAVVACVGFARLVPSKPDA